MQNPDIIGVTEVQDNNGRSAGDSAANESYERLIAEIENAGGVKYEYVNIDPVNNARRWCTKCEYPCWIPLQSGSC